jgi:ferredoxin
MRRDREGFDYPVANPDRCIGCGKCEKVCPVLNPFQPAEPLCALAARSDEYVSGSASGGVFPAVAAKVIAAGGVVYGAVLNEDMTVGHADAEDMEAVCRMRGSKYVQSDLYGTFEEVRYYLGEGRRVMFTGTPCQIAGLKSFLGKEDENLLTVDCACHGVPSPGLWEKYVKALEVRHGGKLTSLRFRDKSRSWMHYDFVYAVGADEVRMPYVKNPYMALFLQDMSLRPSCYNCPARGGRSGSDLTLADLWSVADTAPDMNDDKGVSLVLVNSEKGRRAVAEADIQAETVDVDEARKKNGGFAESVLMPERREEFFKGHHSAEDLIKYMKGFITRKPLHKIIYGGVRSGLSKLKRRICR